MKHRDTIAVVGPRADRLHPLHTVVGRNQAYREMGEVGDRDPLDDHSVAVTRSFDAVGGTVGKACSRKRTAPEDSHAGVVLHDEGAVDVGVARDVDVLDVCRHDVLADVVHAPGEIDPRPVGRQGGHVGRRRVFDAPIGGIVGLRGILFERVGEDHQSVPIALRADLHRVLSGFGQGEGHGLARERRRHVLAARVDGHRRRHRHPRRIENPRRHRHLAVEREVRPADRAAGHQFERRAVAADHPLRGIVYGTGALENHALLLHPVLGKRHLPHRRNVHVGRVGQMVVHDERNVVRFLGFLRIGLLRRVPQRFVGRRVGASDP